MPDPWDRWDDRVKEIGQPRRVAEALTDAELLTLLAAERQGRREREKWILRDELAARLQAASRRQTAAAHREAARHAWPDWDLAPEDPRAHAARTDVEPHRPR